ncbi:MAG: tRNA (cytidine(34)-2'-O)-methyltransferase [Pseudomonadota bacterium]
MPKFKIVLYQPLIPGNTGSIGRTCVGLDVELILIRPYGFEITERSVRRAGLDYWKYVQLKEYQNWEEFLDKEGPAVEKLFFFSRFAKTVYYQAGFTTDCYLVFGQETKGLPQEFFDRYQERFFVLPSYSEQIRSFNLANIATAVAFEALRQIEFR